MNFGASLGGASFAAEKPVAAICHGPWMIIEAEAARGRCIAPVRFFYASERWKREI